MKHHQKLACLVQNNSIINTIKKSLTKLDFSTNVLEFTDLNGLLKTLNDDIDYVLIDMDNQNIDFKQLLQVAKDQYPSIIRILLAETWTPQIVIMANQIAHLVLEKKQIESHLIDLFKKADRLRHLLQNKDLIKMVNSYEQVPILKPVYMELLHKLQGHEVSLKQIGEFVEGDIALSTKVLQVSNMAVFSKLVPITSPKQAVVHLGINVLRALILYIQLYELNSSKLQFLKFLKNMEKHSLTVAKHTKIFAEEFNLDKLEQNDCFTVGFLHDIGKLVIAEKVDNWEEIQQYAKDQHIPLWQAEEKILGTSHAEIGGYLLGIWGFPAEIIDAVAYHHKPSGSENYSLSPTTFVHIAEAMLQEEAHSDEETFQRYLDIEYLEKLNIKEGVLELYKKYYGKDEKESIPLVDDEPMSDDLKGDDEYK